MGLVVPFVLVACGSKAPPSARETGPAPEAATKPIAGPIELLPPAREELKAYLADVAGDGRLHTEIETSAGTIHCELLPDTAPMAVANFMGLAMGRRAWLDPESDEHIMGTGFYDGVTFHRVVSGYLIQAGDRTGTGKAGPGYTFPDEVDPKVRFDHPGALALANTGANSNGSQFFITERAMPHLNGRHTLFGHCDDLDVVRRISTAPASNDGQPENPVRITHVKFWQEAAGK